MDSSTVTRESFRALMREVTDRLQGKALDLALQNELNECFPAQGEVFARIFDGCRAAIAAGWMCEREGGGIKYGRVIKPDAELNGFSVDVVDMNSLEGPHHSHPNGEIDLIMPLTAEAKFDGSGAGWLVYGPGSAHFPTVTDGRALILYLLPQGAINFTR
jgi:hypothetical protein